nr:hypothetical protein [Tanacetum cinerariifolium]
MDLTVVLMDLLVGVLVLELIGIIIFSSKRRGKWLLRLLVKIKVALLRLSLLEFFPSCGSALLGSALLFNVLFTMALAYIEGWTY